MVIDTSDFSKLVTEVMEPIFANDGFTPNKESGVKLWMKQTDNYKAAISYEKLAQRGRKQFTFRLYITDGWFFDPLSYRRSHIPSWKVQRKLGISKSKFSLLIGDDWLEYPDSSDKDIRRGLEKYASELTKHIDELTPKAIKWLNK